METRFCYHAANYDEVRYFYEHMLSWRIYKEWDRSSTDRGVVYHAGAALLEVLWAPPENASRLADDFYIYMEVADLQALRTSLRSQDYAVTEIQSFAWGHDSFIVRDPAGLVLKFFTTRPQDK